MRLLETTNGRTYRLTKEFLCNDKIPAYAILSHTWVENQEVTLDDINEDNKNRYTKLRTSLRLRPRSRKLGYDKLRFCARQAKRDGLRYFWVDTCCIDQRNDIEVHAAINSMFRWYQDAAKCYVYLTDVSSTGRKRESESPVWEEAFMNSRWFTRGWTLQELLAPTVVEFFSREGVYLGDRLELRQHIHIITDIPIRALSGAPLNEFGVDERLSWAVERETTRDEDEVYALLGIFDVKMPFIYEGYDKAMRRLLEKIANFHAVPIDRGPERDVTLKSTVPFRRDNDFISRDSLGGMQHMLAGPTGCAALVGLGGVGKSQIAIEYAHQVLDMSPDTWVFWVQAETQARFREGYYKIAEKTKVEGWDDPKADIMQLVRAWLHNEANGRWVLIIDSADDAGVFFHDTSASFTAHKSGSPTTEQPFSSFLPQQSTGSILVTSRSREVACRLIGAETNIIEVEPMDDHDALALLQKKFMSAIKRDEADALINALDRMPLALTQAAAFINRTPRMSISKYLKEIEDNRASLLNTKMVDIRRDADASNSIITTWQMSFDYIRERSPTAARLLSLMSLFDRQGIPKSLLEDKYAGQDQDTPDFEHDMYMLTSFCLVKPSADGSSFEMHGLVQYSTKRWLELNKELKYWKEMYVALIDESFPEAQPENWPICQAMFPHAQTALDNHPFDADGLEKWASISWKAGWYMGGKGEYERAYKLALDSLDIRQILLDSEDIEIVDSLHSVGVALSRLGRYKEAKKMYQKAVEAQERILGAGHLDTLTGMLNLASLYNDQGHWTDAEKLLQEILKVASKKDSKAGRSLTWSTLATLATTYDSLGRHEEAENLELQILKAREAEFGPDHLITLTVKSNLAHTYSHQGRWREAEELHFQVLKTSESCRYPETEILATKAHLARIYEAQGHWCEAENIRLEVLTGTKAKLGLNHPDTFDAIGNLAGIYYTQGRFSEAETLQLQLLDLRIAMLGEEHPSTINTKGNLAVTYWGQERYSEAEALDLEVLNIRRAKWGDEHPHTLDSKMNLASSYRDQGRFKDAEHLEEVVVRLRKETLGIEHPTTLANMGNLAVTYRRQRYVERAYNLMEECYQGHVKVLGMDHPHTVRYREGLAKWRREDTQATTEAS